MPQLIQMRQRIKSIETIEKITHAMQLVSMSLHMRLRDRQAKSNEYATTLRQVFTTVADTYTHPLLYPQTTNERILLILVGSQKGLCGSFNTQLFHTFENDIKNQLYPHADIISVGKKATEYIQAFVHKSPILLQHKASYDTLQSSTVKPIAQHLLQHILTAQPLYDTVRIYANHAQGFFTQRQHTVSLIPFIATQHNETDYIWEDRYEDVIHALAEQTLSAMIYHTLVQSLVAEQAARFISMDSATSNAQNLRETMKLQYNKLRQAKITKELTELTSSFT